MTPHPRSYRPDLPSHAQSHSAIMSWARSLEKDQAAEIETSPRKLHPRSYRPDLSHWGYSFAQLSKLTAADRATLRNRPLVVIPDAYRPCPVCAPRAVTTDYGTYYGGDDCERCHNQRVIRTTTSFPGPINEGNIGHYASIARHAIAERQEAA